MFWPTRIRRGFNAGLAASTDSSFTLYRRAMETNVSPSCTLWERVATAGVAAGGTGRVGRDALKLVTVLAGAGLRPKLLGRLVGVT